MKKTLLFLFIFLSLFFVTKFTYAEFCEDDPQQCDCENPSTGSYCCECEEWDPKDGCTWCCISGGCQSWECQTSGCDARIVDGDWTCCWEDHYEDVPDANSCRNNYCSGADQYNYDWDTQDCYCYTCGEGRCSGAPIEGECWTCGGEPDPPDECEVNPSQPSLISPASGTTFSDQSVIDFSWNPNVTWGDNCDSKSFVVEILDTSLNPLFDSPAMDSTTGAWSNIDNPLLIEGNYNWRVRASNEHSITWSETRSFYININEPHAVINSPTENSVHYTGSSIDIYSTSTDSSSNWIGKNLENTGYFRREDTDMDGSYDGGWSPISDGITCNDQSPCYCLPNNCPGNVNEYWIPAANEEGLWEIIVSANSYDNDPPGPIGQCTGVPEVDPSWGYTDCDENQSDDTHIVVLNPPTAEMASPVDGASLEVGTSYPFTAIISDSGNNLRDTSLWRRKDNGDNTYGPRDQIGSAIGCDGDSCSISASWAPTDLDGGDWIAYMISEDDLFEYGGICTGYPILEEEADCGRTGFLDMIHFSVNACGAPPDKPTLLYPLNGAPNIPIIDLALSWKPYTESEWGEVCNVPNRSFTVYYKMLATINDPCPVDYDDPGLQTVTSCINLPAGQTECSDPVFNLQNTKYCWYVKADNGEQTNNSFIWSFITEIPLSNQNWFTAIGGSVYAGAIFQEPTIPGSFDWIKPYITYDSDPQNPDSSPDSMALASSNIDIKNAGDESYSQSDVWAKYASFSKTWPGSPAYRGQPPSSAIPLSDDCSHILNGNLFGISKIDPYKAYVINDLKCAQDAIDGTTDSPYGYKLSKPGTAVIYITGDGDLTITNEVVSSNPSYHLVFVIGPNISLKISKDLQYIYEGKDPYIEPEFITPSLIEAAFIITKGLSGANGLIFEGGGDPSKPEKTVVVDGPVVTQSIELGRNRGDQNGFPSEIFKYNPIYLYDLTSNERIADKPNMTGLFTTDIDWIEGN